ncbi:hypothetical protein PC0870_15140 [Streptococcus pneumoniae]|nr:hypothetical protein PC0870_15140 [Streptococcus pneumoniae]
MAQQSCCKANMNKQPPLSLCESLYSFENLTVLVVPIEYVLGRNEDDEYQRAGFARYWCNY